MRVELPGTQPGAGNRVSSGPDWSAITSVHAILLICILSFSQALFCSHI